jgi:hypothetical protein
MKEGENSRSDDNLAGSVGCLLLMVFSFENSPTSREFWLEKLGSFTWVLMSHENFKAFGYVLQNEKERFMKFVSFFA